MLFEPRPSQYDLNFSFLGFGVRIAWGFWLVAAILGWNWARGLDAVALQVGMDSPGPFVMLLIWIVALMISILVHEWGHAFAFKYYGVGSRIVLYHFGGLAIPDTFTSWSGARQRRIGPSENIVISAAGPAAQMALGLIVWGVGHAFGFPMWLTGIINNWFGLGLEAGQWPVSAAIYAFFDAIVLVSTFWALLNLIPVLPLDGGQIMRSILLINSVRDAQRTAHLVSVIAGALAGLYCLQVGQPGGIMFLLLAASNWQSMQQPMGGF